MLRDRVDAQIAATLAFHNATSRYLFALGRERIVPRFLGEAHPRFASPARASLAVTIGAAVLVLVTVLLNGDPYLHLLLWTNGVGIVGIVLLQLLCMIAVIRFFSRDRRGHGTFRVCIAPAFGAVGLAVGLWLMLGNFELLTGMEGWANAWLVAPMIVLGLAGTAWALRLRRRDPVRYASLGAGEGTSAEPAAEG